MQKTLPAPKTTTLQHGLINTQPDAAGFQLVAHKKHSRTLSSPSTHQIPSHTEKTSVVIRNQISWQKDPIQVIKLCSEGSTINKKSNLESTLNVVNVVLHVPIETKQISRPAAQIVS